MNLRTASRDPVSPRLRISAAGMPPLEQSLLGLAALGLVAMLSLPAARGADAALGWMPLWLLGMPLASWCALRLSRMRSTLAQARAVVARPAFFRRPARSGTTAHRRLPAAVRRVRSRAA